MGWDQSAVTRTASDQGPCVPLLVTGAMRTRNWAPGVGAVTTRVRLVALPSDVKGPVGVAGVKLTSTACEVAPAAAGHLTMACAGCLPFLPVTFSTLARAGGGVFTSRDRSPAWLMVDP